MIHVVNTLPQMGIGVIASRNVMDWIKPIEKAVADELHATGNDDGSHDMGHLLRVSTLSRRFAKEERANDLVTYAAGMLHDIVNLPKNHPNIKNCSLLASMRAKEILTQLQYPEDLVSDVCHAIHAHSFSANVEPETVEAKCVQDADRMEALGAFGLMRVFYCSGKFGSMIMDEADPGAVNRELNDKKYALDHFPVKLFTLFGTMKTDAGRRTAESLSKFLDEFRNAMLKDYHEGKRDSWRFKFAEVYHQAGRKSLSLFHSDDPFASQGRKLEPARYALDALLESKEHSYETFFTQLKFELNGYQ